MGKKRGAAKPGHRDSDRSRDDYLEALGRLQGSNLRLLIELLGKLIEDFSQAEEFSFHEKRGALTRLLITILRCSNTMRPDLSTKPKWNSRNRASHITPREFLRMHYDKEISENSLSRGALRSSDYPLYKALSNPHWIAKESAENPFATASKETPFEGAASVAETKLARNAVLSLLPPELRTLLRQLHATEMRLHRSSKK
jgi:hypothetical protein